MDFIPLIHTRRSIYQLNSELPVSAKIVEQAIANSILECPTAFNSQTGRVVLLWKKSSDILWQNIASLLQQQIPAEKFHKTKSKIDSFSAGAGTILFFSDNKAIEELQKQYPLYSKNFISWDEQSAGMLQYMIWTSLAEKGIGASLQHYNPIIDSFVQSQYQIPQHWRLLSQMPFGGITQLADAKSYLPLNIRYKIFS